MRVVKLSDRGVAKLKAYEVFMPYVYDDAARFKQPRLASFATCAGQPTWGYGHVLTHTERTSEALQRTLTERDAYNILCKDLRRFEDGITQAVHVDLNQNQADALIIWAFNCGINPLSRLIYFVNKQDFKQAAKEFGSWVNSKVNGVKKVNPGLVKRRALEAELFTTPMPDEGISDDLRAQVLKAQHENFLTMIDNKTDGAA